MNKRALKKRIRPEEQLVYKKAYRQILSNFNLKENKWDYIWVLFNYSDFIKGKPLEFVYRKGDFLKYRTELMFLLNNHSSKLESGQYDGFICIQFKKNSIPEIYDILRIYGDNSSSNDQIKRYRFKFKDLVFMDGTYIISSNLSGYDEKETAILQSIRRGPKNIFLWAGIILGLVGLTRLLQLI